jgi:Phage ABA sandwich domain
MADDQLRGRDLDVAVAENVMQWPAFPYGLHNGNRPWLENPASYPHVEICDDHLPYTGLLLWNDKDADGVYWSPSLSVDAAMQVAEKMRERGWRISIMNNVGCEKGPLEWSVDFARGHTVNRLAAELPEAICRAAAIGDKKN